MDTDEDDEKDPKIQDKVTPEYRNLIAIPAGKGKGGMQAWLKVDPTKVRRISLSEQELEDAVSEYGKDIVRYKCTIICCIIALLFYIKIT